MPAKRRFDPATAATHPVLIAACLAILLPVLWTLRTSFANRRIAYDSAALVFTRPSTTCETHGKT